MIRKTVDVPDNNIILVTGHFGAGKTNVSANLAKYFTQSCKKVFLIDYDTVNPYFRAADAESALSPLGVTVLSPEFANTNVEILTLPPHIHRALDAAGDGGRVIFDVGGDDLGATALGVLGRQLKERSYSMLYVFNAYRPLTETPLQAYEIMLEIEQRCGLKVTALVNNSNIGSETTAEDIENTVKYADELSKTASLPVIMTTYMTERVPDTGTRLLKLENFTKRLF